VRAVPHAIDPDADQAPLRSVVIMGVTGCGKTAVAHALADTLGWRMIEGDSLHPPANVALMSAGIALDDEHRWGWLDAIGAELVEAREASASAVAACSALKRAYRDRLRGFADDMLFVYLAIDRATAAERVAGRKGHFMPASLVESQFAALEAPGQDENAIALDGTRSIADLVAQLRPFLEAARPAMGEPTPLT
jgi:gluconokinase